jgi:galactose oxidase
MAGEPKLVGEWEERFPLPNVAAHASLVPKGDKIVFWGRRANPWSLKKESMNETKTSAFLFDIKSMKSEPLPESGVLDKVNLFCSGHCWQPDGTLIVVGGHISDGVGSDQACVFDPESKKWTALEPLPLVTIREKDTPAQSFKGRWYPSVLCLSDGSVLCISGSSKDTTPVPIPVIWRNNKWEEVVSHRSLALYPDIQLGPDGRVFLAGPQFESFYLDLTKTDQVGRMGGWIIQKGLSRESGQRDYASCIMYEPGKIVYIGGGIDLVPSVDSGRPTSKADFIDLNKNDSLNKNDENKAEWETLPRMNKRRRQHNGTILPDGSIGK